MTRDHEAYIYVKGSNGTTVFSRDKMLGLYEVHYEVESTDKSLLEKIKFMNSGADRGEYGTTATRLRTHTAH